jgi:acyl-coenzyme A synthetase/AMP-(fatty) acid ligase
MNITDMLANHAGNRPTHPAIVYGSETITYRDLNDLVNVVAARLYAAGLRTGDEVALILPVSTFYLVVLYALGRLGVVVLPIEPDWPLVDIEGRMERFGVTKAVISTGMPDPAAETVIRIDSSWWNADEEIPLPDFPDDGDLPYVMVFSSGTTGMPKGPLLTHNQMIQQATRVANSCWISPWDRCGSIIDTFVQVAQLVALAFHRVGATVVLFRRDLAIEEMPEAYRKAGITWAFLAPRRLRLLLALTDDGEPLMPFLRQLVVGGGPLFPDERAAARRRITPNFFENYGSNEGGFYVTAGPQDHSLKPESVGRVVPSVEAQVVDQDHNPVPTGEIGMIRFRGPAFPTEYHMNPEASADAFRDGWFYPKDAALIDEDGYVFLKGRVDDVINVDGHNVYPADIESTLVAHPAVRDAAAVGYLRPDRREVPVAFVVLNQKVERDELHRHCRQNLAYYKVPHAYVALDEMPRNPIGKILKTDLKMMAKERLAKL